MFKQSIQTKILGAAITVTIIGFSALIYMAISHEKKSLLEERENSSRLMAEPILTAIYEDMLDERPDMARYGGEEFVVISAETDKGQTVQMAERMRKVIEGYPFPKKETQPGGNLTVSIGVTALKADAEDADGLIKKADDALYKAKETGRNKVVAA